MTPPPLYGLKVVDIGWLMVGPASARYLTDLGADTIKAESGKRLDPLRALGPHKDGQPGAGRSISYHMINAGKRGLAVDMKSAQGPEIVRRLAAAADIFIESFTPGAIDAMGLSYAQLSQTNPGLIMVSTGILGRKGLIGLGMSGTGITGSAFAGATNLLGWPDRPPEGPSGPWTDAVAPRYVVAAILAALHRRRATGQGCYIDVAQAEAGLQFLAPAYLEFAVNGHIPARRGTAQAALRCPYGVYPCTGQDRWLAIDASSPAAWQSLRAALHPHLDDPQYDTLVGRLRARDAIDAVIAQWTRDRDALAAEVLLQAAGVPAHVVANDHDLAFDADLEAEGFYRRVDDPILGEAWITAPQFHLDTAPHAPTRAGPTIGDSSSILLAEWLGMTATEIDDLHAAGVLA